MAGSLRESPRAVHNIRYAKLKMIGLSSLLVPERFDGIQVRGFPGGIETEENPNGAGEEKGDGDDRRVDQRRPLRPAF